MKILKILSGILSVVFVVFALLIMSVKRQEKIPVRSFERNYLVSMPIEKFAIIAGFSPERIDVFGNNVLISERSENNIRVNTLSQGEFALTKAVFRQEGLVINWNITNEKLFNADIRKRKINMTDLRSNKTLSFDIVPEFTRIIQINDSLCLLKGRDSMRLNDNYGVYNYRRGSLRSFGNLLNDYNDGGFVNDGYFISDGNSKFYHICYYVSDIIAFNANGHPIYKTVSIDKVSKLPKTVTASNGTRFISSETPVIHPAAAATERFVFVVSNIKSDTDQTSGLGHWQVIDVYSTDKCEYKGSMRINDVSSIRSIACSKDKLYYLTSDHIGAIDISGLILPTIDHKITAMLK